MLSSERTLKLRFHGKIIDHLGIQMYQSPVAAVAELVSNAWDADAENAWIKLPGPDQSAPVIEIRDDGAGMTFEECQSRYLNVGYNRRGKDPEAKTIEKKRPVLGRKGIGKFAGFGIAQVVRIDTISKKTGERTVFDLDIERLRGEEDEYLKKDDLTIKVLIYEEPDEDRKKHSGTTISLRKLLIKKRPNPESFSKSMSRRFLLHQRVADFNIFVNGKKIPKEEGLENVQYTFPRDYRKEEEPEELKIDKNGWGEEKLPDDHTIRWRFVFYKDTIKEEEMRGIAVFANGKLAQSPFMFNITGGISGQNALEYLSGRIEADYLDALPQDVIATERQRINWYTEETDVLLQWGQGRVKRLAQIWKERRSEEKLRKIEDRTEPFSQRLANLPTSERRTIEKALRKLASVESIDDKKFTELSEAVIFAWEKGRLRDLIDRMSTVQDMNEQELVSILVEADVLTALNVAEVVRSRLETIKGLEERIRNRDLENAVRDYIAKNPWLLSPEWETYKREETLNKMLEKIRKEHLPDDLFRKRIDLVLASGNHLLVVEFMRPGLTVNRDHIHRYKDYVYAVRSWAETNSMQQFSQVSGLLVADNLARNDIMRRNLRSLKEDDMDAVDWNTLLNESKRRWEDFLFTIRDRSPKDKRIESLASI